MASITFTQWAVHLSVSAFLDGIRKLAAPAIADRALGLVSVSVEASAVRTFFGVDFDGSFSSFAVIVDHDSSLPPSRRFARGNSLYLAFHGED
jgi:hypothetical protein